MKKKIIILLVFAFYLLALNPYLGPATYDDVVYFLGAESLAKGEGYLYQGKMIGDWPPLFSALLSLPMRAGFSSVWAAKLMVLAAILLSFFAVYALLEKENRDESKLTFLLFALAPIGYIFGSRVMSEWVFIAIAYLFILSLYQVDKRARVGLWHLLAGILLGAAILTRYAGVFLLVPLFAELIVNKNTLLKDWISKGLVALIGLSLFLLLWILPFMINLEDGSLEVRYYQSISRLVSVNLWSALETNFQLMAGIELDSSHLILSLPLIVLLSLGIYKRISNRPLIYGDYWALITLVVCFFLSVKTARYLLPVAPILFSYMILGIKSLLPRKLAFPLCLCWVALFGVQDLFLLTQGNQKTYNGLNVWVSPTPVDFYRGYWHDLYSLASAINTTPHSDQIRYAGDDLLGEKYLYYFTSRALTKQPSSPASLILYTKQNSPLGRHSEELYRNNSFVLLSSPEKKRVVLTTKSR